MAKDYVGTDLKITYTGILCLEEFYQHAKQWFVNQGYDWLETKYREVELGKKKNIYITWSSEKKHNDYIKYTIDLTITIKDVEEIKAKKKNTCQCNIEVNVTGYLNSDYEERWKDNKIIKFLKEAFNHYTDKPEMDKCTATLQKEMQQFINELKAFFNVKKLDK
ncbi:MAG: hypothetical protein Q7R96_01425 [Nanoarchaeota archaeon]|nr:hypothetical protein [Nanoarchaeota archaeon]